MDIDKLLIAEYGYDKLRDAAIQTKIELERYCRQSQANSELSQARTDALLAGTFGLTSIVAAVAASPALLVAAPFAAYFAHAAMSERDKALLHATSAAIPDSALQAIISQYEQDNPPTVVYDVEPEGRLAEEPALGTYRL